ncbi:MAG: hypothetical protein E7089_03930 [Bacteroidales bacterium]|nr:hypothetical protein [Bacteroidales bacterium]
MLFIALIAKAGNYVTPTDQGVYRIINLKYNLAMAEDFTGSKMICDEIGHANQGAINMIGNTEISNNLFSNMVLYKFGRYMSRGGIISETSKNYENKVPYSYQVNVNLMHTTRMFWQLYLYYHVAGNNPEFFQRLFIALRNDPIKKHKQH